jgi:hypothetical protein
VRPGKSSPRGPAELLAFALALLATVGISACASSARDLDSVTVERAIATSILKERDLYATVACPAHVPQREGHVFTCITHLDVGTYPVTVTEVNGSGRVRFQDDKPLVVLNIAKVQRAIEASILSQRHLRSTVSCPANVLQRAGLVFRCTVAIDGQTRRYSFVVSELDDAGHVRYVGT